MRSSLKTILRQICVYDFGVPKILHTSINLIYSLKDRPLAVLSFDTKNIALYNQPYQSYK